MELSVDIQLWQFVYAIIFGAFLGIFYDIFRIIRTIIIKGKAIVVVEDIIYLFVSAILTFCFAFYVNDGQLRFFIILGIFLGVIIYYFTIGILVIKSAKIIVMILKKCFGFVFGVIIYPFAKIFVFIKPFLIKIIKKLKKILFFLKNRFLFLIKTIIIYREEKYKIKYKNKEGGMQDEIKSLKRESIKAYPVCNDYSSGSPRSSRLHKKE